MTIHTLDYFFEKYNFSERDRYDTLQIYTLLKEEKQKVFIQNFDAYAKDIQKLEEDIVLEKNILIGDAVEQVKKKLLFNRKQKLEDSIQKTRY